MARSSILPSFSFFVLRTSRPVSSLALTIGPDQDIGEALGLMASNQVRRLPVVEGETLIGVVAQADVARSADERRVGETVEQISR